MTAAVFGPCLSSVCDGSWVCSLPAGHEGRHVCRQFGRADGSVVTSWNDYDEDTEPCWCAHEEDEHRSDDENVVTCTRCGSVRMQIDDPNGPVTLETIRPRTTRRIRYECMVCGVAGCHGCQPPLVLRGFVHLSVVPAFGEDRP